jgi:hypothetical protein
VKRRDFIVGLAAAPLFIRRAFGDASVGGAPANGRAATSKAAPTLVFVVPRGEAGRWERGLAFGELLNKGSDRELAPLAFVDAVCAHAADFGVDGEPLLLYVAGGAVHRLDGSAKNAAAMKRFLREMTPLPSSPSVAELAATARARWVRHAPRGARWGNTGACGVHYEEGPQVEQPDCGMAFAPEASRRFLDFYVKAS